MAKDWKGGSASTFKTIGASNHTDHERGDADYYATEPAATDWLCKLERFKNPILEPSCGEGHISKQLIANGYEVVSRDLVDRGYGEVADFLFFNNEQWNGDIVTNPPYAAAQKFVEQALNMVRPGGKVAMFLKLTFLEGKSRWELFKAAPPHSCMGQLLALEVRHEWRFQQVRKQRHRLCLVHLGERIQRTSRNTLVQPITNYYK
jgi:hypothetical protein